VAVGLALVVGALLTGGWLLFGTSFGARSAETARAPKKVVILPFTNLGPAGDEYFADGIAEEITARLAVIGGLRVIGSTSAQAYKGTKKTIAEIGRELGVDYVLEGSVRWQKPAQGQPRVRVTPQLVSTADGTHLWAEVYDEPLDEIFRVQADIAQNVVRALNVTLGEPQRRVVEAVPTRNVAAYDYYLRGNDYRRRGTESRFARSSLRMYEKAVELDSNFAVAYAMLALAHNQMYWMYYDRSDERRAQAKRAIDRAFELEPGLPEAHLALGAYYTVVLDYDRGLREYDLAKSTRPLLAFSYSAVLRARQGKLRESLRDFEKAWQLDPASVRVATNYAVAHDLLREFPRAEALYDRAIALGPDRSNPYSWKAWLYLRWDGRTERARGVLLEEARAAGVGGDPFLLLMRVMVEIVDGRYREAIDPLASEAPEVIADQYGLTTRTLLYAQTYGLMQRPDLERVYYDSARSLIEQLVQERPDDPRLHSALGIAYAGLGRRRDAIREGEQAVTLLPIQGDAFRGYYRAWDMARIYAMVGEYDAAVDRLEHLLSIPGHLTPAWLRIDPTWDPLRGHPGFQRLVARGN
jgi:serine/threonine-protein kinase